MKNVCLYLMAGLTLLIGSGCATTQQYAAIPDLNKEIEVPTMGRIYVIRATVFGLGASMRITDNGQFVGDTGPNGYLCWERGAGKAEIACKAENTSKVSLDVSPGKIYYIRQHIQMGLLQPRTKLEVIDEEKGKELLQKCKPPKTYKPPSLIWG